MSNVCDAAIVFTRSWRINSSMSFYGAFFRTLLWRPRQATQALFWYVRAGAARPSPPAGGRGTLALHRIGTSGW
jgi:hypothetical protein